MVRRALIVLCVGSMTIFLANCGQTYKLVSISVSPAAGYNLTNAAPQGALMVTANYSNSKTGDVTSKSSYEIIASSLQSSTAPSSVGGVATITVNGSGLVTANAAAPACTWSATTPPQPSPYQVEVSFTDNGVTATALVPINVATAAGCDVAAQ